MNLTRPTLVVMAISSLAVIFIVGSGVFLGFQLTSDQQPESSPTYHGTYFEDGGQPKEFTLTATSGAVSLSDYRGKVVALFFGYANCPDVCPATMAKLARVYEQLGSQADAVQVIMVTVDPARDTPERMEEFVAKFHPDFLGLSGTQERISRVASDIGIQHERESSLEKYQHPGVDEELSLQFQPGSIGLSGLAESITAIASETSVYRDDESGAEQRNHTGSNAKDFAHSDTDEEDYLVSHTSHIIVLDRDGRVRLLLPPDLTIDQMTDDFKRFLSGKVG